jgi:hypothetical protein
MLALLASQRMCMCMFVLLSLLPLLLLLPPHWYRLLLLWLKRSPNGQTADLSTLNTRDHTHASMGDKGLYLVIRAQ